MKRTFSISMKRSANYQSIEVSEGYEAEFETDKDFEKAKQDVIKRVKKEVEDQLNDLNKKKITLEVKE